MKSGGAVLAEVDGDSAVLVVEHGDEFQAGAEGFEVVAQGRDPYVLGVFEFRDGSLGDIEPAGELGLADRFGMTKLIQSDLFKGFRTQPGKAFGRSRPGLDPSTMSLNS